MNVKRSLSILLAALLCVSLLPGTALAGEVTPPVLDEFYVTLHGNGGAKVSEKGRRFNQIAVVSEKAEYKLPACPFQREGWTFAGWSQDGGNTVTGQPGDTVTLPKEPSFLYAMWEKDAPPEVTAPEVTPPEVTAPGDTALYGINLYPGVTAWVDGQQVTEAPEGAAVTLRVTPPEGQGLTELTIATWMTDIPVPLDGFTFTMPAEDVRVFAIFGEFVGASSWEELCDQMRAGKNVRLTDNVIRTDGSSLGGFGTLDLNGFCLDGGEGNGGTLISGSYDLLHFLTIRDNSPGQTGTILYHGGPVIYLLSGTSLTLAGGSILPAKDAEGSQYVVLLQSGSRFSMIGGSITGNYSGVQLGDNCSFTMTGGSITGSNIGVQLGDNCSFTMTGGSVTGNSTGVDLRSGSSSFTMTGGSITENIIGITGDGSVSLSGSPVVTGNDTAFWNGNVKLDSGRTVTVTGPLEEGAALGVRMDEPGVFAEPGEGYTLTEGDISHFSSDAPAYTVVLNGEGKAALVSKLPGGWPPDSGEIYSVNALDEDTHEYLKGATIAIIEKETGTAIDEWVSGDGPHESRVLEKGTVYILRVLDAPEGYKKPDDNEFMINQDGDSITVLSGPCEIENGGIRLMLSPSWTALPSRSGGGGGSVTYAVNVEKAENGSVTASGAYAAAGKTVTLTVKPDEGYQLDKLTVTDKNGQEVAVTSKEDGSRTFTMPGSAVTVAASFAAETPAPEPEPEPEPGGEGCPKDETCPVSAFTDASPDAWYHDGVHWALENGVMNGTGETTFDPNGSTTRAMVVTMLWRLEGKPTPDAPAPFTDVEPGAWYADAVAWAAERGVVKGITKTEFAPNAPVTREQLAAILYRYAQTKGQGFTGSWYFPLNFKDAAEVSDWADEAMHWMVMKGIIQGRTETTLNPKDQTSRAETATILMRYFTAIGAE